MTQSTRPPPSPPPGLPPSPPRQGTPIALILVGRAVLIIALALAVLLFIVAWPIAHALSDILSEAIRAHGAVVAGFLLVCAALSIAAAVRGFWAFSRRVEVRTEQAGVVKLQSGQPVRLADLALLAEAGAIERFTALHYQTKLAEAQRQFPELSHFHQAIRLDGAALPVTEPSPALIEPPPGLEEAIRRGWSTAERWYVGADPAGQPLQVVLKYAGFVAVSGLQGTGKTNLAALVAGQCAAHDGVLFVADPHLGDAESLASRIEPFSGAVERFAVTAPEINALVTKVGRIYERRCVDPRQADRPILLVVDEFMDLMVRGLLDAPVVQALMALSGTGRKKKIFVVLISQNWGLRMVGPLGVAIRQCVTHSLVCRSSEETAKFLLPSSYAQQALMLRVGQSFFFGPGGEPILTATPELRGHELHIAARGRAPRPYAPWQLAAPPSQPALSTIPPTTPIAPAHFTPPTERLGGLAVPDQIVDLLRSYQGWLTATEIADQLGVGVQVIRTELTPLWRKRLIARQGTSRSPTEKYEYAVQGVSQSTSQHLTPSA